MPKQKNKKQENALNKAQSRTGFWSGLFQNASDKKQKTKTFKGLKNNSKTKAIEKKENYDLSANKIKQQKKGLFSSFFGAKSSKKDSKEFQADLNTILAEDKKTDNDAQKSQKNKLFGGNVEAQKVITIEETSSDKSSTARKPEDDRKTETENSNLQKKEPTETSKKEIKVEKSFNAKEVLSGFFGKKGAKVEKDEEQKEKKQKEKKGKKNMFVDLFPQEAKSKEEDSLIETIVEQSDQTHSILGQKLDNRENQNDSKEPEETEKSDLLFWSQIGLVVAIIIPSIVFVFFYFQVTSQSSLLDLVGQENPGMRYQQKIAERDDFKQKIAKLKTDITKLEETSKENLMEKTINHIKSGTNDWLEIMENIIEVTNEGVPYNDRLRYVSYNSYGFSSQDNAISLSAKIISPNGQAFTLATFLIEAINESEYFEGMENRNFSKSINDEGAEMSLALSFNYIPEENRESVTTVLDK